jgi:hypothetical protein
MGRMKDIFMEVMETYGKIPDDFNLTEYKLKKELEDAEWEEYEENLRLEKEKQIRESSEGTSPGETHPQGNEDSV